MGNQKNQTPAEGTAGKTMTKYDRKMQARKEAEAREKRQRTVTRIAAIIVIALIAIIAIAMPVGKRINAKSEYIRIGNHSLSKIDYDFYYGYSVNSYLSAYAQILPYIGLDTTKSFDSQSFDETMTWQQYFNQLAVSSARQYLALADDAKAAGFEYDVTEDYNELYATFSETAENQNISLKSYLKNMFGSYATKASIKDCVTTFLTAQAYYAHLLEENTPDDIAVSEYYKENKKNYDNIHYYAFDLQAEVAEDATDEERTAALAAAKEKAEKFASRYTAGEDFLTLCREYATEEQAETYADDDAAIYKSSTYSNMHSAYRDWLFEDGRKENDITVVEGTDVYHIVIFLLREKPDTVDETISNTLASEAASEYVDTLTESYALTDTKNHLKLNGLAAEDQNDAEENDNTDAPEDSNNAGNSDSTDNSNNSDNADNSENTDSSDNTGEAE